MELNQHLAILTLDGELADVHSKGKWSCIIYSALPIEVEALQILQMEIAERFNIGTPVELEERRKYPIKVMKDLLTEFGYEILDAGNISVERKGCGVWVQEPGHNYHSNILKRLVF